ncbi:MAG: hypothetical protein WKG01_21960 [Kofleriaceae bacterium]
MASATKSSEVHRILERYLREVVEAHELCPWARTAREAGEIAIELVWGAPGTEELVAAATIALARPQTRVAMIVAPELAVAPAGWRAIRDTVAARLPTAGIAEFHPAAALDLTTPARLVRFLRRAPDPVLQLVPLALLERVRGAPPVAARAHQAQILGGHAPPPRADVGTQIAAANHATVSAHHAAITATLDAIADDRRAAYARVGITSCR